MVLQIVFNEISAAEMSALPKEMQLDLLAEFQFLPEDLDKLDTEKFGVVERDGKQVTVAVGQTVPLDGSAPAAAPVAAPAPSSPAGPQTSSPDAPAGGLGEQAKRMMERRQKELQ